LDRWVDPAVFQRLPLPYAAGWLAAQAFLKYRRGEGTKTSPLPDFYIGAQAEIEKWTLVTRDAARYRTYFPNVRLIAPT
jgi:predicted nucleic acid-binding protein